MLIIIKDMKTNKPINLNKTLIDLNGKVLRPLIRFNFLFITVVFRNIFRTTKLKDILFLALEKPSEKSVKDMSVLSTWINLQRKVQKGGIVSLNEEERNLINEILPLRESPWFVGQIFDELGLNIGKEVKTTSELVGNLPALNKKRTSAKSLERKK